jgi:hypothetical protein
MAFLELVKSEEQLAEEKKVREAAAAQAAEAKEAKAKAKGERTAKAKAERVDKPARPHRGAKAGKPTGPGKMAKPRVTKKPEGGE